MTHTNTLGPRYHSVPVLIGLSHLTSLRWPSLHLSAAAIVRAFSVKNCLCCKIQLLYFGPLRSVKNSNRRELELEFAFCSGKIRFCSQSPELCSCFYNPEKMQGIPSLSSGLLDILHIYLAIPYDIPWLPWDILVQTELSSQLSIVFSTFLSLVSSSVKRQLPWLVVGYSNCFFLFSCFHHCCIISPQRTPGALGTVLCMWIGSTLFCMSFCNVFITSGSEHFPIVH